MLYKSICWVHTSSQSHFKVEAKQLVEGSTTMLLNSVYLLVLAAGSTWAISIKTVEYAVKVPVWDASDSYARLVKVFRDPSNHWSYKKKWESSDDYSHEDHKEPDSWSYAMPVFAKPTHFLKPTYHHTTTTTTKAPITKPTQSVREAESYDETTMIPTMKESEDFAQEAATTDVFPIKINPASRQPEMKEREQLMQPKPTSTPAYPSLAPYQASLLCILSPRLCGQPDDVQVIELQQPIIFVAPANNGNAQRYVATMQLSPHQFASMFYGV